MGGVATPGSQDGGFLTVPRYRRVVVKLSGEALAGSGSSGVDPASLSRVAEEVLSVHDLGVQVAVVVGGGNYFRGRMAEGWGISRAEADNIGMLGTIMNALMLRGALTARTDTDVRVMTAVPIHSVAEPFIRLRAMHHLGRGMIVLLAGGIGQPYVTTDYPAVQRALELEADALLVAKRGVDGVYDTDPHLNPDAVRYTRLTYDEALATGVRIMDTSAFVLANEQSLTMHVFDVAAAGVMRGSARAPSSARGSASSSRCPPPGRRPSRQGGLVVAGRGRDGPLNRSWACVHCRVASKSSLVYSRKTMRSPVPNARTSTWSRYFSGTARRW